MGSTNQEAGGAAPVAVDINKWVDQYVALRDALKKYDERAKEERKKITSLMDERAGRIQRFMDDNNITENLKTKSGTCYLSTRYSASVQDGEAFMAFVKAGNWDMIERRANPTAVRDYVKKHNELPAGVNLTGIQTLGVRRPGKDND